MKNNDNKTQEIINDGISKINKENVIETMSEIFGDRHIHIDFDAFMPEKKHMKKCEDIIINSLKKRKENSHE